jgi:hypothetical protein
MAEKEDERCGRAGGRWLARAWGDTPIGYAYVRVTVWRGEAAGSDEPTARQAAERVG